MRIGVDARCFVEGRRTGIEEYSLNLLKNLFAIDTKNNYVLFLNSFRQPKSELDWIGAYPNVKLLRLRIPNKLMNFCFWYLRWPKMDRLAGGTDVFFIPNIIFRSISRRSKKIVTFHDLSFERHPEFFSWKRRLWHALVNPEKIAREADTIIAVSESTKNDLISLYKINPKKIFAVHSGIEEKFKIIDRNSQRLIAIKKKYQLPYKFILSFGTIEPRKNIIAIIRAYGRFRKRAAMENNSELAKFKLVIAGSPGWLNRGIYAEIQKSECRADIIMKNFVDAEDKKYVFNLASLFVYPSSFEGFGFPPAEAMRCGVPVIASNNSSLPEVAGSGAILIDPDKPEEIFAAMWKILKNKDLKKILIQKGLEKSINFDWKKTAREFLGVIQSMV